MYMVMISTTLAFMRFVNLERRFIMIVKIGDKLFYSDNEPIMVVLSNEEKNLISNMGCQHKFCSFPQRCTPDQMQEFMNDTARFDNAKNPNVVKMTLMLYEKFPREAFSSYSHLYRLGVEKGLINHTEYLAAREYYGNLWMYTGD